ncbi:MAG TPA: DUF3048 domain-containing protein [Acidimicrobiales bacterium]|nr:DUF3048 domain-containing protein [Acidimicrobiales bacterium]
MRRLIAPVVVALLLAPACGSAEESPTTTTRQTTTTAAAGPIVPLTGRPGDGPNRPALVVKIDNAPKARPQAGINLADLVVEEAVEGGITRLFTVFHSQDPPVIGPVRSARSTDIALAAVLNRPLFAYSGANNVFLKLISEAPMVDIGVNAVPGAYRREKGRPALYDLFSSSAALFGAAPQGSPPPPPIFEYGPATATGRPAQGVHLEFKGRVVTLVDWQWDAAKSGWVRTQNGTAHVDAEGTQVTATNVVVQVVPYEDTGIRDQSGEPVPEAKLIGEGRALIFRDGMVFEGKWKKASPEAITKYSSADGKPLTLNPGQTWIELERADANGVIEVR